MKYTATNTRKWTLELECLPRGKSRQYRRLRRFFKRMANRIERRAYE